PYTGGHLMVVPYQHVPDLSSLEIPVLNELMLYLQRSVQALRAAYNPGGINMGLNLVECAVAGIAADLHFAALPRWLGDANFMTVVGETRVIPESLEDSWVKLKQHF